MRNTNTAPVKAKEAAKVEPMKLWVLQAKDPQEPPFHFAMTAVELIVAAASAEAARRLAALDAGPVWADDAMTSCDELMLSAPAVVARESERARVARAQLA